MSIDRCLGRPLAIMAAMWAVACGGDGGIEPEPPPQPNRPPVATGSLPAQTMTAGESAQVNVAPFFTDPDGDPLTYTATISNNAIATVSVSGSLLTVSAVAAGTATVAVTATDLGGLSASQTIPVTVTEGGGTSGDRAALVALYNATDGPNWVINENWLTDAPLGEWYGVDTDDFRGESCKS